MRMLCSRKAWTSSLDGWLARKTLGLWSSFVVKFSKITKSFVATRVLSVVKLPFW